MLQSSPRHLGVPVRATAPPRRPLFAVALFALFAILAAGSSVEAGGDRCPSSRAADELLNCDHCQAIKKLLTSENIEQLDVEVHDLEHGVIVQINAATEDAVALAHDLAEEMWTPGVHAGLTMSKACAKRESKLEHCSIDRALTDTGAIVVLWSEDRDLANWLRDDALDTRGFVLSAASR